MKGIPAKKVHRARAGKVGSVAACDCDAGGPDWCEGKPECGTFAADKATPLINPAKTARVHRVIGRRRKSKR
jgi:hypothetical protein